MAEACGGCWGWICEVATDETDAVVATTNVIGVDGAVFGDGCGTAAGAGLIDDVVGCALGDTAAPEFNAFLPRALCNMKKTGKKLKIYSLHFI